MLMQDLLLEAVWEMSLSLQGSVWPPAVSLAPWWERSLRNWGLLLSQRPGLSSLPSPNPSVLWLPQAPSLRFSPFLVLAASLLPVPLLLRRFLGTHPALGPPAPWIAQPYPARQLDDGDCHSYSLCLPCLSPVPMPACPRLLPGGCCPARSLWAASASSCFLQALFSPPPWPRSGWPEFPTARSVLPARWREAAGARSQEAAFARGAGAAAGPEPEPSPRSTAAAKIHRFVLSFLVLVRKKGARSVLMWGVGSSERPTLCLLGGWCPCFAWSLGAPASCGGGGARQRWWEY